jgi:hypothetical protein
LSSLPAFMGVAPIVYYGNSGQLSSHYQHESVAPCCDSANMGIFAYPPSCPAWDEGLHLKYRIISSSHL